ncbi:unnamed protein product [Paramecium pentaurelia]|uniref:Uncharacterized protein n=1 Tax=Paramecium pentaurelia TaxID=43138 RepID=A0A8S1WNH0_9CILI|nr:unnamed protein product [Paramecium pentaurelia]
MLFKFLFFQCLGIVVEAQYIQNFVTSQITNNEGWAIINPYNGATTHITDCGGNIIFGGYQVFGCISSRDTQMMKYFILPPHYHLRINVMHWKIDDWPASQNFYIILDSKVHYWQVTANTGSNLCGDIGTEQSSLICKEYPLHTFNSVTVSFHSSCNTDNFWGITDFSIELDECYNGCLFCLDQTTDCIFWIVWKSYFDLQNLDNGSEGWKINQFSRFQTTNNQFQIKFLVINKGLSAINYFLLPDHNSFIIQFCVDYPNYAQSKFIIYLNDEQLLEFTNNVKYVPYRSSIINDSRNQIKLEIQSINDRIAIRELKIILRGPINLISCIDDNMEPFDGCFAKQESCQQGCLFCVNGQCLMCDNKWIYDELNNNCEPLCGDKFIIVNEQCDDGNNIEFDGCYQCQFSCPLNCYNCLFGKCQECITGYYYSNGICNQINEYLFQGTDLILRKNLNEYQISLAFGDLKFNQLHLYYQEKLIFQNGIETFESLCSPLCQVCQYNKCLKCLGNHLLLKNQCIPRITQGVFLIEDGIHLSEYLIGCNQCQESCQIQCLQCQNSYCILCIDGWQLLNGQCKQVCGDNQVAILSQEQCDSNLEDCLNCNIYCSVNCQYCLNNKECLICNENYVEINHKCQLACSKDCKECIQGKCVDDILNGEINFNDTQDQICGDGIKQQSELCDDGNNIQFDGCYNCQYSCPLNCVNCIDGICYECEQQLQLKYNQCYEYCGNGKKNQDELCDDGNIIDADGCSSSCKIEVDYKCIENDNGLSECQYYESPQMKLKFLNQTFNKYYIDISFTQPIYFKNNYQLESLFDISIDDIKTEYYAIKLESNYQPTIDTVLNFQFLLEISLFISTNNSFAQSNIQLTNEAFNENEMKLLNPSLKMLLKQYIQMNKADIDKTKKLSEYQEVMIIGQGIICVISIMSGNYQMLIEILDNLQYLAYLKYINIIYPENLYLFFESTNLISINPVLDFFSVGEIFEKYIYQDFIQSYGKLKFYSLNANLITNLQFFFIQVIAMIVLAISLNTICYISIKLFEKNITRCFLFINANSWRYQFLFKVINFIYNIFHQILILVNQFNQNGVQNILLANAYDLLFKTFLFLTSNSRNNKISLIQSALSYFFLAALALTIILLLKHSFKKIKQSMNDRYKAFYLLKQFFFCYYLICFQNDQFIQLLMLTTTNLIYLLALISVDLNLSTLVKMQIIIQEISIIVFTFTSIFHLQDYSFLISGQNQIALGFSQIYLLISGLLWIFIKYVIMIYSKIKQKCIQYKKKKQNKKFRKVTHLIFQMVS